MRRLCEFDLFLFDCDGVILDSNTLKINAMHDVLTGLNRFPVYQVEQCVEYFASNFGKSRFHHVEYFLNNILTGSEREHEHCYQSILSSYSLRCKSLYLTAQLTPGILDFLDSIRGDAYVVSGSDQQELRDVFLYRGLSEYFDGIYGSPITKSQNISSILNRYSGRNAIMFGDAISDYQASIANNIDFVFYRPFSNVMSEMSTLAEENGFPVIDSFNELK